MASGTALQGIPVAPGYVIYQRAQEAADEEIVETTRLFAIPQWNWVVDMLSSDGATGYLAVVKLLERLNCYYQRSERSLQVAELEYKALSELLFVVQGEAEHFGSQATVRQSLGFPVRDVSLQYSWERVGLHGLPLKSSYEADYEPEFDFDRYRVIRGRIDKSDPYEERRILSPLTRMTFGSSCKWSDCVQEVQENIDKSDLYSKMRESLYISFRKSIIESVLYEYEVLGKVSKLDDKKGDGRTVLYDERIRDFVNLALGCIREVEQECKLDANRSPSFNAVIKLMELKWEHVGDVNLKTLAETIGAYSPGTGRGSGNLPLHERNKRYDQFRRVVYKWSRHMNLG